MSQAATRAGVPAARYRALEKDCVPNSQYILRKLVSVCRRLDMESVRVAYIEEIGQYANIDLSRDAWREPATAFLDVLEANVAELQDVECFISPAAVFGYLERIGFGATLASRKPADKQMVELLTGAVFTMFLDEANDYYVKPVKDGIDGRQRLDLLKICKERCRRKSTMITAQLPADKWHALTGEPIIAGTIADRLIHHEMLQARFGTHINAMIRANSAAQCWSSSFI